jgi:predicted nucleotidyltransferase
MDQESKLPETTTQTLDEFVAAAQKVIGANLSAIVLYGSAAEGRLRATSDVNLLVVLTAWNPAELDALAEPLRNAHAAIGLSASFVLVAELSQVMDAFAVKYGDILRRRRLLCGNDPFAGLAISRAQSITRLRQVLLNLLLRLRERYLSTRLREEQAAKVVAHTAGPLRAAAASLLALEGRPAFTPKAALEHVAAGMPGEGWQEVLANLSRVREGQGLAPGVAPATVLRLLELVGAMREQAGRLGEGRP